MKILLLSFYYTPDLCPGSFRAASIVEGLISQMPPGAKIDVITTMPNRYSTYSAQAPAFEQRGAVSIRRIALPAHRSGMLDQSKAFFAYARGVHAHHRQDDYDLVIATSSRLMTAVLGAWVTQRSRKARLYLDIRDIFVDTIKDVLPQRFAGAAKTLFGLLERWTIPHAHTVNLISAGFEGYFKAKYPRQRYTYFTNGIDKEFLPDGAPLPPAVPSAGREISVVYAGNVGEGQGLHLIIPELAERMRGRVRFSIVGDGGMINSLRQAVEARGLHNVSLLPPMKRSELIATYLAADVLFVHLNDYDAFKKVLPSKLFEYGATGLPIWAGVAGYAAHFTRTEITNAAVFSPCDPEAAVAAFETLRIERVVRRSFIEKFTRTNIAQEMASDMLLRDAPVLDDDRDRQLRAG